MKIIFFATLWLDLLSWGWSVLASALPELENLTREKPLTLDPEEVSDFFLILAC